MENEKLKVKNSISELVAEQKSLKNSVVDLSHVFKVLQIFNHKFSSRPSTEQKELIAGSIKVTRDTAYMAYYDSSQAELIDLSKGLETKSNGIENDDREVDSFRSLVRPNFYMVDQAIVYPNRSNLSVSFSFVFNINVINPEILRDLYLKQGLSASQIGAKFNASKSHVLSKLQSMGIRKDPIERKFDPKNYRQHNPPYGYQVKNGELKEYRACFGNYRPCISELNRPRKR